MFEYINIFFTYTPFISKHSAHMLSIFFFTIIAAWYNKFYIPIKIKTKTSFFIVFFVS